MNHFEWRTEEDEPRSEPLTPVATSRDSRRKWPYLVVTLLLLATAGLLAGRQVRRQVSVAENTAADDVRHAFYLAQQALARGDAELYSSLLDRTDTVWLAGRQEAVEEGVSADLSFAGLVPQPGELEVLGVTLSPDLSGAELRWRRSFTVDAGSGLAGTATLEYVDFYRYQEGRWLLAPPPPHFWGPWETSEGQFLTLVYPERDTAVGRRLATDLDELMARLCPQIDVAAACQPGNRVQLRFGTEANRLLNMARYTNQPQTWHIALGPTGQLELPAPTLLGHPLDEAGYQALYRAYGRFLTRVLVATVIDRSPGSDGYLTARAAEGQLLALGLITWPPAAAVAAQVPLPVLMPDLVVLCPDAAGRADGLRRYNPASARWQPLLTGEEIYQMVPLAGGRAVAVAAHSLVAGEPRQRAILYAPQESRILLEQSAGAGHPRLYLSGGAVDSRLFIWLPDESSGTAWQWLDVPACLAGECRLQPAGARLDWSPGGEHTLFWLNDGRRLRRFLGDSQGNPVRELDVNATAWLSAGEFAGIDHSFGEMVNAGNEELGVTLPQNTQPEASQRAYGLAATGAVVLSSVGDEAPRTLLTAADLLAMIPVGEWPLRFNVTSVWAAPGRADLLLIQASGMAYDFSSSAGSAGQRDYLFLAGTGGAAHLLWSGTLLSWVTFSPDGRWLAWIDVGDDRLLAVYDLQQDELRFFDIGPKPFFEQITWPSFDWSADGRWLVVVHDGLLYLVAPEYGYRHVVIPEAPGCRQAAWVIGNW
jgi:hypothetical protein